MGKPVVFALPHAVLAGGGVVAPAGEMVQPVREVERQFACRAAATAAAFAGGAGGVNDDFGGGGLDAGYGLIALHKHVGLAARPEGVGVVTGHGRIVGQDDGQLAEGGGGVRGRPRLSQ